MRRWPDTLPTSSSPGFGLSPVDPVIRSDMEVGAARVRRVTFARLDLVDMAWRFTDVEMAAFRAWWNDEPWSLAGDSDSLTGWVAGNATFTADTVIGPNEEFADRIDEDSATSLHRCDRVLGAAVLQNSTILCRATLQTAGRTWARLGFHDWAGVERHANINLATGVLGTLSGLISSKVEDRGNGWWRVTITAATGTGVANPLMRISLLNDAQVASYLGAGVVGINACEKGVRHVTGYDLHLRTDAAGKAQGAAGSEGWAFVPIAVGGGFRFVEARFKGPFKATALSGLNWDVSAQMEVRNA